MTKHRVGQTISMALASFMAALVLWRIWLEFASETAGEQAVKVLIIVLPLVFIFYIPGIVLAWNGNPNRKIILDGILIPHFIFIGILMVPVLIFGSIVGSQSFVSAGCIIYLSIMTTAVFVSHGHRIQILIVHIPILLLLLLISYDHSAFYLKVHGALPGVIQVPAEELDRNSMSKSEGTTSSDD